MIGTCAVLAVIGLGSPAWAQSACTSDSDCTNGQVCDDPVGVCIDQPGPGTVATGDDCVADVDCAAGDVCDQTTGLCAINSDPQGNPGDGGKDGGCSMVTQRDRSALPAALLALGLIGLASITRRRRRT
jgi:Cys-rich repeat protein